MFLPSSKVFSTFSLRLQKVVFTLLHLSSSSSLDFKLLYTCSVIRTNTFGLCLPGLIPRSLPKYYKSIGDLHFCGFCILPKRSQLRFSFHMSNDYCKNSLCEKRNNICLIKWTLRQPYYLCFELFVCWMVCDEQQLCLSVTQAFTGIKVSI